MLLGVCALRTLWRRGERGIWGFFFGVCIFEIMRVLIFKAKRNSQKKLSPRFFLKLHHFTDKRELNSLMGISKKGFYFYKYSMLKRKSWVPCWRSWRGYSKIKSNGRHFSLKHRGKARLPLVAPSLTGGIRAQHKNGVSPLVSQETGSCTQEKSSVRVPHPSPRLLAVTGMSSPARVSCTGSTLGENLKTP